MRFGLIFLILMVASSSLQAQERLNLCRCIRYAIDNNLQIKNIAISKKLSQERLSQSRRDRLPDAGFYSGAGISFGKSIDPNTNDIISAGFFNSTYNFSSSITLFDGFRMQKKTDFERFRLNAEEFRLQNAEDELAFDVMTCYYDIQYYKGLTKIARDQAEASALWLKMIERKAEAGLKSVSDIAEVRANLQLEEVHKVQAENKLNEAMLNLQKLMNVEKPIDTADIEEAPESFPDSTGIMLSGIDPDIIFNSFLLRSPLYLSEEANYKAETKSLSISRSNFYPAISGGWSIGSGYYETNTTPDGDVISFARQLKDNRNQYLGVSLNFPLFTRMANRSAVSVARLNAEQARNSMDNTRQNLYFGVCKAVNDLKALQKESLQYVRQQDADSLALAMAEKKFAQGLISVVDYYVAKNRFANSQSQVLRSALQLDMQARLIAFYEGDRFWE
ncbi:MAG TPA: TolC family protein [Bacteroidales bacterium]|nr:TolC family protein [Bacteroidales bacterium]HPT02207.1 TolC family protein [Bacteroidales bacterium]